MYTAQSNGGRVRLPAGTYKTSDCLHLGYGTSFRSVVLEGEGYNYRGEPQFCGTTIKPTFSDRPAINIQGGRGTVVRGLSIIGVLKRYIESNRLGSFDPAPTVDDTNPATWHDPGAHANQDARYAPYAGIAIDAYSGARPATPYPDVSYPSFLGTVSQYGKSESSDVLIEDVYIAGFAVGVTNQPCDHDGNGDFTSIHRCQIEFCKWGISVGNTQSRNVHIQGLEASYVYTVLTNRRHGKQMGKFGGAVIDLSCFALINIVDFGSFYPQPVTFINLYAESLWRIGSIVSASRNEGTITFLNCEFNFHNQSDIRGVPTYVVDGGGHAPMDLRFVGSVFSAYPSVVAIAPLAPVFDGCFFRNENRISLWQKFAHNALAGGLVTTRFEHARGQGRIKVSYYDLDTGSVGAIPIWTGPAQTKATRNICTSVYASEILAADDKSAPAVRTPFLADPTTNAVAKTSLSAISLSNKTLTLTFRARADWQFYRDGPLPGDVIWDDDSGSVFFVYSRSALTVLAELQNNYRGNGAGRYSTLAAFSPKTGNLYFVNSRVYTPENYLRGDTAVASATITNVARDDGHATWFDAQIAANDYVWVSDRHDNWVSPTVALIRTRDQAAGTITLAGSTGMRTQSRRRLDLFIRQPPAKV
jgi:hypothetical protein